MNIGTTIGLRLRKTHAFVGEYQDEDEWETIGSVKVIDVLTGSDEALDGMEDMVRINLLVEFELDSHTTELPLTMESLIDHIVKGAEVFLYGSLPVTVHDRIFKDDDERIPHFWEGTSGFRVTEEHLHDITITPAPDSRTARALEDTFSKSGCACTRDCCGCVSTRAEAGNIDHSLNRAWLHLERSRNY